MSKVAKKVRFLILKKYFTKKNEKNVFFFKYINDFQKRKKTCTLSRGCRYFL